MNRVDGPALPARWMGWRLRALVALALAACVAIFVLLRWLADARHLPLAWQAAPQGQLVVAEPRPAAPPAILRSLRIGNQEWPADAWLVGIAPRWLAGADERERALALHAAVAASTAPAQLHFADGSGALLQPEPRGVAGVGWGFWPLAALALAVLLVGAVVALARPHAANLLYLAICGCQFASLLLLAASLAPGVGLPPGLAAIDAPLRTSLDALALACAVQALAVFPQRPSASAWPPLAGWAAALLLALAAWFFAPPAALVNTALLALAGLALWVVWRAQRPAPQPVLALVGLLMAAGWLAAALAAAAVGAARPYALDVDVARAGAVAWTAVPALLLLAPLAMRSRQALREFALLAGISTVAAALDLLFVTVFSLGAFASLALVVFVALAVYAWLRQWMFERMLASHALTTERIFDQLYRAAREVQAHPEHHAAQLAALLRDLFEPLEVARSPRRLQRSRVAGGGSSLLVPLLPLPDEAGAGAAPPGTLMLHFARRGRRIFTREDARLADRVVEQLRRAVAYDLAVERGRAEERTRIAQDLHDDIGARLLTLMYQAPNAEMEDYLRHTLKDLKTLTRGLATGDQRWSHAVAEWKSDIAQRLGAAGIELVWDASHDDDPRLSVVQWSALTRVLRELVSNAIHHAEATQLRVRIALKSGALELSVSDDGRGGDPQRWSQGLGLGGVKKRVKLLGGEVRWRAAEPRGISCEVRVPELTARR